MPLTLYTGKSFGFKVAIDSNGNFYTVDYRGLTLWPDARITMYELELNFTKSHIIAFIADGI
jgi:hypothetical protein